MVMVQEYITVPVANSPANGASCKIPEYTSLRWSNIGEGIYPGSRVIHVVPELPVIEAPAPEPYWISGNGIVGACAVSVVPARTERVSPYGRGEIGSIRLEVTGEVTYRGFRYRLSMIVGQDPDYRAWTRFDYPIGAMGIRWDGEHLNPKTKTHATIRQWMLDSATDYAGRTNGWQAASTAMGYREAVRGLVLDLNLHASQAIHAYGTIASCLDAIRVHTTMGPCWSGFCISSECDGCNHVDATGFMWREHERR